MHALDLSQKFAKVSVPSTDRIAYQLTQGAAFCYPLYYFVPSIWQNYLIHHRAEQGDVQLWRLDLDTGESVRITNAASTENDWRPWDMNAASGVLDHRSALNPIRGELIWFDGQTAHRTHIASLADEVLFTLPQDRIATGQNCVTLDGRYFVYIDHDSECYAAIYPPNGARNRHLSTGTRLRAFDLDTGAVKTLITMNAPLHHVHPLPENRLAFSSPAMERGILFTDLQGGWYTHLRTQDDTGGMTCHYCATRRGIFYEVRHPVRDLGGVIDPDTHQRVEFALPSAGDVHVGFDPDGLLWMYERAEEREGLHTRDLRLLTRYEGFDHTQWLPLAAGWPSYAAGQRGHMHPRVTPDRRYVIITAGDASSGTNHIYALDIADLAEHENAVVY